MVIPESFETCNSTLLEADPASPRSPCLHPLRASQTVRFTTPVPSRGILFKYSHRESNSAGQIDRPRRRLAGEQTLMSSVPPLCICWLSVTYLLASLTTTFQASAVPCFSCWTMTPPHCVSWICHLFIRFLVSTHDKP